MIRKIGFTLAEVLITLGIIGIVAQMTIPTLMNNVAEQQFKSGLKKTYSVLSQVTASVMNENSGSMKGVCSASDNNCLRDAYLAYMKTTKSCDDGVDGCFKLTGVSFKCLDGSYCGFGSDAGAVLNDGVSVDFWYNSPDCTLAIGSVNVCGELYVDVNGPKVPNTWGKDLYIFHVTENGIVPSGNSGDGVYCDTIHWPTGHGCAYTRLYL